VALTLTAGGMAMKRLTSNEARRIAATGDATGRAGRRK
jgi:hypothetical protein